MSDGPSDESAPGDGSSPPPPPVVSPDGKSWWDGSRWQPFTSEAPASTQNASIQAVPAAQQVASAATPAPVPPVAAQSESGGRSELWWAVRIAVPVIALAIFLVPRLADWMSAPDLDVAGGSLDGMTCDDLGEEAVRISDESTGFNVKLLKVHEPTLVEDNREDYDLPTGADRELVMACRGGGSWADGDTVDVRVELSVDADGETWVFYKPMF